MRRSRGTAGKRLEGDFGEIGTVLEENAETFGDWRHFQQAKGAKAFGALVDKDRLRGLSKSARVLVDECVVAGLDYNISASKHCELKPEEGEVDYWEVVHLEVEGRESAIVWEALRRNAPTWPTST